MREKRIIIWPKYFDSNYSISEGRKISRQFALKNVRAEEIHNASLELGLKIELRMNAAHPRHPWEKSGMILVEKSQVKRKMLMKIAEKIRENRELRKPAEKK
ncbi:signal recognition particle protein Srp19 [Candidatus Bathyarchaeota archaeon]|nr:signal recognition particle protein Srp19 [Candidatus Bathyarchaeota archaeon]